MGGAQKRFYSTLDVSRFCGVHVSTAIRWIDEGRLPAARTPGGIRRITPVDLAAFLLKHGFPLPEELKAETPAENSVSIGAALEARFVLDHLPVGVTQLDEDGRIVYANRKLVDILSGGTSKVMNVLGKKIEELPHVAGLNVDGLFRRLIHEGEPIRSLFLRFTSTYGRKVNISVNSVPVRDCGERLVGNLVFIEDVGVTLELEREAGRTREFFNSVIETANVAIMGVDAMLQVVVFNRKAQEITGYSPEEANQPDFLLTLLRDPESVSRAEKEIKSHFEGDTVEDSQWFIQTKSGEKRVLSVSTSLVRSGEGRILAVIVSATDITDRELLRRQIQESNDFLTSIIDNSPFSLQIVNREGWTIKVNRALARLMGVAEADLVGIGVHNFFKDKRLRSTGIADAARKAFGGEIAPVHFAEFTPGIAQIQGSGDLIISAVAFPIVQREQIQNVGIIYEDITEKALLQRNLVAKNEELEAFVYTVTHDLKSPLGIISTCCQIIDDRNQDPEIRKQTDMIARNTDRMREFIGSILSLSRAGKWDSDQEFSTPVSTIVKAVFQDIQARFPDQDLRLKMGKIPTMSLHPDAAIQLFQNLLSNAHKYRHPDRTPEITVECKELPGVYRIAVSDNGLGIRSDERKKIFDVFYRGRDTERAGTGVGLAIVKRIVERAGGRVWVESAAGKGSTFYFTIPRN